MIFKAILVSVSLLIGLMIAEWISGYLVENPAARIARERGVEFDTRNRLQVVQDLRSQGQDAYPAVPPNTFLSKPLRINGKEVIPLSGVATAKIVGCNESGYFSTFRSDQFGFRNPPGSWEDSTSIELAFVGDSYTAGDCVNEGDHFVDRLRDYYPKVVNLASGGNGPLLELAVVKEYLRGRRLRYLFWVYFERNDLNDLHNREHIPALRAYLESDEIWNLVDVHQAIDIALRQYVEDRLRARVASSARILPNLRLLVWRARNREHVSTSISQNTQNYDLRLFERVMLTARSVVEGLGGKLVFVYLPEYERFSATTPSAPWSASHLKEQIVTLIASMGIDVIDIESAFREIEDPLKLFPFELQGHYNSAGYSVVAREIQKYLDSQVDDLRMSKNRSNLDARQRVFSNN